MGRIVAVAHPVVATGTPTSVNDLLAELEAILGRAAGIPFAPPRAGDVTSSCLSVDRIRADLGWSPSYSLTDGLRAMLGSAG